MSIELPIFPLNIVAFPGEGINLHIFEPRYKQLVNDCLEDGTTFGIASHVLNKIELGTEVKVTEVTKRYSDGRMDIKTQGLRIFEVKDFQNPWKEKLYAGATIEFLEDEQDADLVKVNEFKELVSELFGWLGEIEPPAVSSISSVFDIGHKIGLKPEEEYLLLEMRKESIRLGFAINHLSQLIPALERAHNAQEKIKQNGHFKHLDPLKF
jgi:hypothetical protein